MRYYERIINGMVSASEYAILASASYARDDDESTLSKITNESKGRFRGEDYEILEGDRDYKVFQKKTTGEIIVSCRGTAIEDDIEPDVYIAAGVLPFHERSQKITNVVRKYRKTHDDVTVTGHSLGGALAAAAAVRTDTMAVTFNQGSSPVDGVVQGIGKVLGYRYKNVLQFATCNDLASVSACKLKNVTTIRIPTASSSILDIVKNHRLGQFLLLDDEKYKDILTSTKERVSEHQQSNPSEVDGPTNPVTKTIGSAGAAYASYKAFIASLNQMMEHLRIINDPTLNGHLDRLQNAIDNLRQLEDEARGVRDVLIENSQRTALDMIHNRLRSVSARLSSLFRRMTRDDVDDVLTELDGIFDATYDQHSNAFFDHMSDEEIDSELDAIEEKELDDILAAIDTDDVDGGDDFKDLDEFLEDVDVDAAEDGGDDFNDLDEFLEDFDAADEGLEIEEVGAFIDGVEGAASIISNAGPLFAALGAITSVALGVYRQQQIMKMRTDARDRISNTRAAYSKEFHSLLNKLSTYVRRPTISNTKRTYAQTVELMGSQHTMQVPVETTVRMPTDTGRWKDSEYDYYGPEALRYLQWRVANPNIVGPTKDTVEGIGSAYRTLISPGPLWPAPGESTGLEDAITREYYNRKQSRNMPLKHGPGGVANYIEAYEWLMRDNIKLHGDEYKNRIESLMAKHTRHRFDELSAESKRDWIMNAEKQLYVNLDTPEQIKIAQLSNTAREIVYMTTVLTRGHKNASIFVTAAGSLYNDYTKMMTVDMSSDTNRQHTRDFLTRTINAFIQGVTALSDDDMMFDAFRFNGSNMNSYQVYVSTGTMHKRRQWYQTVNGNTERNMKIREWMKDDAYSMDSFIQDGNVPMGDNETEAEFVDRYTRWVYETASTWEWKTHKAVVVPHIPPHHSTPAEQKGVLAPLPDAFQPLLTGVNPPPMVCVRKRRRNRTDG